MLGRSGSMTRACGYGSRFREDDAEHWKLS